MNPGTDVAGSRSCCVRMRIEGRRQAWMPRSEIPAGVLLRHGPRFWGKCSDRPREDGAMAETAGD